MPITGEIQGLYRDREQTQPVFPLTKVKAVSDDDGVGLNVLLDEMVYKGDAVGDASVQPRDADTLGGRLAADYATQSFVTNKIAEAQLGGADGGSVDLSGYATKDYVDDQLDNYAVTVDTTLSVAGQAADAKAVGDALDSLDTVIATDENTDGNLVIRSYVQETDYFQVDTTLSKANHAADAKAVGDALATKAPDGYGLGGNAKSISDCHVDKTGFYRWDEGCANAPFNYATMMNISRYGGTSSKIAFGGGGTTQGCIAHKVGVQEWEYCNPPMVPNVTYRTTERYNGKPVYVIAIPVQWPAANATVTITFNTSGKTIVDLKPTGYAAGNNYSLFNYPNTRISALAGKIEIVNSNDFTLAGFNGHVIVKYINN